MNIIYPQLDGVRINEDRTLPIALIQAVRKAYDYLAAAFVTSTGTIDVIQDIHANRATLHPAASSPIGSLYFETDRKVVYVNRLVSSAQTWVYFTGVMSGLVATRPTDLGINDAGFLFTSTNSLDYRWSGSAWVTLGTVKGGAALTHAGAIPLVVSTGILGESALLDNGTVLSLLSRLFDTDTTIRSTGFQNPAAGSGIEVKYDTGSTTGLVVVFDRTGAAFLPLSLHGSTVTITPHSGTTTNAGNLDVTGGVYKIAGTSGISNTVALAKITVAGTNGSLTFSGGIITAFVAPT